MAGGDLKERTREVRVWNPAGRGGFKRKEFGRQESGLPMAVEDLKKEFGRHESGVRIATTKLETPVCLFESEFDSFKVAKRSGEVKFAFPYI